VTVGLKERDTGLVRKYVIHKQDVALRPKDEVEDLLRRSMKTFLERTGIRVNRRLEAGIREEIEAAIEVSGIKEEKSPVILDRVEIRDDSAGGRVIFVVLLSENDTQGKREFTLKNPSGYLLSSSSKRTEMTGQLYSVILNISRNTSLYP
jgi:ribosome-binding factor A